MVIGIGIDTVRISEMRELMERGGQAFEAATFSDGELAAARDRANPAERLAGVFAVKEAVYKALAPRVPDMLFDLRRVRVAHAEDGSPHVEVDAYLADIMQAAGAGSILVSVTNEGDLATAIALAQTKALEP